MVPLIVAGAVAAAANAGASIYQANQEAAAAEAAQKAAAKAAGQISSGWNQVRGTYKQNQEGIDKFQGQVNNVYGSGNMKNYAQKYRELLSQDMSDAIYNPTDFTTDKSVEQYYDKAWKLNNQTQLDALEASASNAGRLYSSGLTNQMASTASANATKAYKEAMEAYLREKGIDVDVWKGEEANKQAAAQQYLDQYKTKLGAYGDYIGTGLNLESDILGATINNNNAKANTYTNYLSEYAKLLSQAGGYGNEQLPNY